MTSVGILPPGTRGFDCDGPVSDVQAKELYLNGFRFGLRYVRRAQRHFYDLTVGEIATFLQNGLAIGIVQHVDNPGWYPTGKVGDTYGAIAAEEATKLGIPAEVIVILDLEEVSPNATPSDVIDYCNRWYTQVLSAGFTPMLYVGYACGLTSRGLYRNLRFQHYMSAYNLNLDNYPEVRGVQIRQAIARSTDHPTMRLPEFDVDTILVDKLGGTPKFLLP